MQVYPKAEHGPLAYCKGKKKKTLLWKIKTRKIARIFSML